MITQGGKKYEKVEKAFLHYFIYQRLPLVSLSNLTGSGGLSLGLRENLEDFVQGRDL